jgi:hypothetical protein
MGSVVTPIILTTLEAETRRIMVQGQSGHIVHKTPSPNNQSKMDWRCGLSGRVPALQVPSQVQTPVSPKAQKKKKKKKKA